jgi:hypothetical protein
MPAFEGLLPEPHNEVIMTLLFRLAEWHALAKLRLHTKSTLNRLESVTTILGRELRRFSNVTCQSFSTEELPKETAARGRRQSRQKAKATASAQTNTSNVSPPIPTTGSSAAATNEKRKKKFNLSTYKVHSLGDYVRMIRLYGTTDSYNSQTVSWSYVRSIFTIRLIFFPPG